LPPTFAAVALLASTRLDASGRRLVQLTCWTPALQLALGTYRLPGPALIGLRRLSADRVARVARAALA
jgi:hypothetical protein